MSIFSERLKLESRIHKLQSENLIVNIFLGTMSISLHKMKLSEQLNFLSITSRFLGASVCAYMFIQHLVDIIYLDDVYIPCIYVLVYSCFGSFLLAFLKVRFQSNLSSYQTKPKYCLSY